MPGIHCLLMDSQVEIPTLIDGFLDVSCSNEDLHSKASVATALFTDSSQSATDLVL